MNTYEIYLNGEFKKCVDLNVHPANVGKWVIFCFLQISPHDVEKIKYIKIKTTEISHSTFITQIEVPNDKGQICNVFA